MRRTTAAVKKLMGEHSNIVGGSNARLRRLCAKSIDEERKVPAQPSGPWADAGTALHHIMEAALRGNMSNATVLREFRGVEIHLEKMSSPVTVTEAMLRNKVFTALDWLDKAVPIDAEMFYEKKMAFPAIEGAFGTGDVVFDMSYQDGEAGIVDWKFGDGIMVSAEDNDQMRFYLCAAIHEGLIPHNLDEYVAFIYQPADKLDPKEYAKRGVYTREDLELFKQDLQEAIAQWREGRAVHSPGAHCAGCRGKLVCPAYTNMLASALATDVQGLNTRQMAEWLAKLPALKEFATELYAAALRNAQAGLEIPGYGLEQALGNSAWKDEKAAWGALGRLGVAADDRTVKKAISPTQALVKLKEIGTPEKQIERFKATHIVRPDNGEKLAKLKPGETSGGALNALAVQLKARGY